jgi:hypothetical protein
MIDRPGTIMERSRDERRWRVRRIRHDQGRNLLIMIVVVVMMVDRPHGLPIPRRDCRCADDAGIDSGNGRVETPPTPACAGRTERLVDEERAVLSRKVGIVRPSRRRIVVVIVVLFAIIRDLQAISRVLTRRRVYGLSEEV